ELERLARRARLPRAAAVALVAAVLAWSSLRPTALGWKSLGAGRLPPAAFLERDIAGLGAAVAARLPPGTLVASDIAPWLALYAERRSVNLPMTTGDLDELRSRHGVRAALITNEWLIGLPGNEVWRAAFDGSRLPRGWQSADTFAFGRLRARLLLAL